MGNQSQKLSILNASERLQKLEPFSRALLAREALVLDSVSGAEVGRRERQLLRVLFFSRWAGVVSISFLLLLKRWLDQQHTPVAPNSRAIFIGINALREREIRRNFDAVNGFEHAFVDERDLSEFTLSRRASLFALLSAWWGMLKPSWKCLRNQGLNLNIDRVRSSLTMRIPDLAFLLVQFQVLKETNPAAIIATSTAGLPAHAACLAGFNVEYHQHGFLSAALVFPDYKSVTAFNRFDADHVASRIPGICSRLRSSCVSRETTQKLLVIAGVYGELELKPVISLASLAQENGYKIVFRPHPLGESEVLSQISLLKGVEVEMEGSFQEFLTKWKPRLLATWYSTTLFDGLLYGALPITFSADQQHVVFPFEKISLAWPSEQEEVFSAVKNERRREELRDIFLSRVF